MVIAAPAGPYFAEGAKAVSIWVTDRYIRAAPGGTGAAKTGGNYAGSLTAQQEAIDNACDQVLFLDALERRWVEELGGMNVLVVFEDGSLSTPPLNGNILEGVTRDSILTLARDSGRPVDERPIEFRELRDGIESGLVTEIFACGTAAVVTSIGRLAWPGGEATLPDVTPVAAELRQALISVQQGLTADPQGWLHHVRLSNHAPAC
jgi:branched-chain amino acid aminotransferase